MSIDDVENVAKIFKPPGWNPTPRLKFDLAVVIGLGVTAMGLGLHIAISCGYLTFMGISGFAEASDMTVQQAQLTAIQQDQKQGTIDRDQQNICVAQASKNQAAMNAWNVTLQSDIAAYWRIPQVKQQPQIRTCEQLMITGSN